MQTSRIIFCFMMFCTLSPCAEAVVPEYTIEDGAVRIVGVGPDNPIIYDNDWWFDVFDNNYLWAQASLGAADLRGNIVSRDMWEWESGYLYSMKQCVDDANKALTLARSSGLKNIPDATLGSDRAMVRPASGRIEDTEVFASDGSRLIVAQAKLASPQKPLLIIAGGPLTTVATALITNPEISPNMVVFNLTVSSGGYNGKEAWSPYVVAKRTRLVEWAPNSFWDKNSVFTKDDFRVLPANPFCDDMKRLIESELGQANQLGDGAALVWLWQPQCWDHAERRSAVWNGRSSDFVPVTNEQAANEAGDVLAIPKSATNLRASREEFFRVVSSPSLFKNRSK